MRLIGEMGEAVLGREGDGNREKTGSYLEREGFLIWLVAVSSEAVRKMKGKKGERM